MIQSDDIINRTYFKNLDAVRFFAAMLVYLSHTIHPVFEYLDIKNNYILAVLNVLSNGGLGVSIFFVLSGFLITYMILEEIQLTNRFSIRNFYMRRVLRIWPLYFAVLVFAFILYPFINARFGMNHSLNSNPLYYFTFLSNFDVMRVQRMGLGSAAMMQNITWSVAIEEQFYVFWPLIFLFVPEKHLLKSICVLGGLSLIFRLYNYSDNVVLHFHTFSFLIDLAIGGFFAFLVKSNGKIRFFFEKTNNLSIITYIIVFFVLFGWNNIWYFKYGAAIKEVVLAIICGFIITSQSIILTPALLEFGNVKIAARLGKYTYGIYLLHPIALEFTNMGFKLMHVERYSLWGTILFTAIGLILTLAISIFSYKYYEKRFLNMKGRFSSI